MSVNKTTISLTAWVMFSACQATSTQMVQPALLVNPGPQTQQELREAVTALTGFGNVVLLDTDLTHSSVLVIERKRQKDGRGELIQGRDLELPQRLQLILRSGQCWLQNAGTGAEQRLQAANCKAAF